MSEPRIPDPALVVLVGVAGSGKSSWAAHRYRQVEIVSSDTLREVVGSGPADLEASAEAFALLERIVTARLARRLTTVVDTLGFDVRRRRGWLALARAAGMPAVLVVLRTPVALCRRRNAARDRPVPARVLTTQLAQVAVVGDQATDEGWDAIVDVVDDGADPAAPAAGPSLEQPVRSRSAGPQVILQISRFPTEAPLGPWLRDVATRATDIGIDGLALMDHLIQIPQVGRPWEPIPEPWVTLGFLAGLGTQLRLGTLVSPVTFRAPGLIAKTAATLSALSGGPTFCGLGAGWWAREHATYGLGFPPAGTRLDQLETCIETVRALWAPGTKTYVGRRVELPETTCYPRPEGDVPIIVGGSGERRTLRIVAELADGCNVPADEEHLDRRLAVLRDHCRDVGRDATELEITVLDVPVIGRDRDDVARRVERHRGRIRAADFVRRHPVGTPSDHAERYRHLVDRGVDTVFVALPEIDDETFEGLQTLVTALH